MRKNIVCLLMALATIGLSAQNFTPGNLIVTRIGDGSAFSANTSPVSLVEYNTTTATPVTNFATAGAIQTPIKTVNLSGGSGKNLTLSSNTASEGLLSLSQNGKYLTLAGYNVAANAAATNLCVFGVSNTTNGLMKIDVTNGGSGYTVSSTVVIGTAWVSGAAYSTGQEIFYKDYRYIVAAAGTASATAPTHTSGSVTNGVPFIYAGLVAKATAIISGGAVSYVYISTSGSGYNTSPAITFTGGTGATATATTDRTSQGTNTTGAGYNANNAITISSPDISGVTATAGIQTTAGGVTGITVSAGGSGYSTVPLVTFLAPSDTWATATAYTAGQVVTYSGRYYTVKTAGTSTATAPTHTSGDVTLGAVFTYVNTTQAATAYAVLTAGVVSSIVMVTPGRGYTSAPGITFAGVGTGASATATYSGIVNNTYLSIGGIGYTTQPTVTGSGPGTGYKQCVQLNANNPYWQGSSVTKIIARVNSTGAVDYSTSLVNNNSASGNPTSVKSAVTADGTAYWVANNTLQYVAHGTNLTTQAVTIATTTNTGIQVKDNRLLTTAAYSNVAFYNALPTSATTAANIIPQTNYNFSSAVYFDTDNRTDTGMTGTGYDVVYLADAVYGLAKYSCEGNVWTVRNLGATAGPTKGILNNFKIASITGAIINGKPVLYAAGGVDAGSIPGSRAIETNSGIVAITDNSSAYNVSMVEGTNVDIVYLAKASTGYAFRGVAFAPSATTWAGTNSSAFGTGSNWQSGAVPPSSEGITIPSGTPNNPVISADTSIGGASIAIGASLTINEGKVLNNTGLITNNGDLILKSSATGTASLVSTSSVNNVTQQRYLSSNQRGWRLLSNPLATTDFNTLATASNITLGTDFTGEYVSASGAGSWTSTDGTASMDTQKAYKLFITGKSGEAPSYTTGPSNVTLVNKGTAANLDLTPIITASTQFYLVANPFTAPVSLKTILSESNATTAHLSNTVSYYDPTVGSNGTTDLIVKKGGYITKAVTAVAKGDANDVVIPPMGAIFIASNALADGTTTTIKVTKNAIFTGTNNSGTYTHKTAQPTVASTNALKVEVSSGETYYDAIALQFKAVGDAGSNIDFGKLPNSILDAYTIIGTQKMAVSELELAAQTIPLGITSTIQKSYTFKVVENTIPADFEAVLVDNLLNTNTVLVPGTNYNFAIDSTPASQGDARFVINLRTAGSSLGLQVDELGAKIQVYPNPSRGEFNISNTLENAATIEISNLNGQVIHTQKLNSGTTKIQTKSWATGVYILKASSKGTETTKKLIIQ